MSNAVTKDIGAAPAFNGAGLRAPARSRWDGDWPRTDRILPWLFAGFLALVWLIPIDSVIAPVPLPFDGTPDRIALLVMGAFMLAVAATAAVRSGPTFRSGLPGQALIAFLAVAVASLVVNAATLAQLGELETATKKTGVLILFALSFFVFVAAIRHKEVVKVASFLVGLASLTAIGVVYEYRTGTNVFFSWTDAALPGFIEVRPQGADPKFGRELIQGPAEHAIAMATMFAMALPFAVVGFMRSHVRRNRILYGIAVGLILAGAFATIRKTGAVGPATALLVLCLYRPRAMLRLLPLGLVIVIGIQAAAPGALVRVKAQIVGGSLLSSGTTQGRKDDYEPAKPDITRHPLIGRGHGSYDPSKYRFLDNEYLQRLIETGIIGAVAYLFLILAIIRTAHRSARSRDPVKAGLGVAIVAAATVYLVTNAVYDQLSFPQAPYMLLFVAAFAVVLREPSNPGDERLVEPPPASTNGNGSIGPRIRQNGSTNGRTASSTNPVDLSVIVVTHNRKARALATLTSARASTGVISTEWLVVDSGSTDGTPDAIEDEWPDIELHRRRNVGFAAANNVALRRVRGRYVLLLNPDVDIVAGSLADVVRALDARPHVGAASVLQCSPDGALLPSIRRFPTVGREAGEALGVARLPALRSMQETELPTDRYGAELSADWLVGAFLIVRREALEAVGELDERFFLYSEETDWCYRIRQAGWEVRHLPVMAVVHHVGDYDDPELRAQLTHSKLLYAEKHFGPLRRVVFRAVILIKHALRAVGFRALRRDEDRAAAEVRALSVASGGTKPFGRPDAGTSPPGPTPAPAPPPSGDELGRTAP